jgi:hypothetical protein
MNAATASPLALAQAFLADVATTEALPGNEDLSRHLSQAVRDLQSHSVREEALRSLGEALRLASQPPTKVLRFVSHQTTASQPPAQTKDRSAFARHLAAVVQRQRLGMLAQVARVLVLDAMKGAQA